jgi:hypothetical protein
MTTAGRNRRASTGVSRDPATNPAEDGSIHRPAASGDRPSTSCRYWVMNSRVPNPTKKLSRLVVSAVVKTAERNSRRSSSGSASRRCRRTNTAPAASPATIDTAGSHPKAVAGDLLEPVDDASTAATDRAALTRSSLPAPGSRNSGAAAARAPAAAPSPAPPAGTPIPTRTTPAVPRPAAARSRRRPRSW